MFARIKNITKRLISILFQPDVMLLPGEIAFFLILSIFPMLILFGLIVSKFSMPIDQLLVYMEDVLPNSVYNFTEPFIIGKGFDTSVGIFMIAGFIVASNGTHSIILASNKLYGFEDSDYIKRRIKSILLIILIMFMLVFTMVVLVFGNTIIKLTLEWFKVKNMNGVSNTYNVLKWPISFLLLVLILKIVYVISPDKRIMSRYTRRGTIFATVSIIVITFIYTHFFDLFNSYNIFYGSLSNIVAMMMWFYFVSYIIVIGIAINVNDYRNKELNNIK